MNKKTQTNVQLVKSMMEFSNYGALAQAFIMDAIGKHAEACSKIDLATIDREKWAYILPEAWVGVAKEINQKLKDHFT